MGTSVGRSERETFVDRRPYDGQRVQRVFEALMTVEIHITKLDPDLALPTYAYADDAGIDLLARVDVELAPGGGRAVVPTGIAIAVPPGHGGFVLPRSGLAAKQGVTVLNGPGLIDAGYRGEVMVPLVNTDPSTPASIRRGDRIAQLVVLPVPRIAWTLVDDLPSTQRETAAKTRGAAGHGSSGR